MRTLLWLGVGLLLCAPALQQRKAAEPVLDPLARLKLGNQRFQSGRAAHFDQEGDRRLDLVRAEHPFALVVSCSDSRVPPEIVFDQGLGDLCVVRCAGEALDDLALASIEHAVTQLDVRTIVVLGHERCAAVAAALGGGELPGHMKYLARAIGPHVEEARARLEPDSRSIPPDVLDLAVEQNVRGVVAEIESSEPLLADWVHRGELRVVGARYDLDSGAVDWLAAPARR